MIGLTRGGAVAALLVGTCVLAAGSWQYAVVLFAFFIPSMLLTRFGKQRKARLSGSAKSGPRNERQVLANGGVAALCAAGAALSHSPAFAAAFCGALSAACADTWATEIGTLAAWAPRSIVSFKRAHTGLSGGVTLPGTLALIAGALFIGVTANPLGIAAWWIVATAGCAGAFADSALGATLQELRYCDACKRPCETDPHLCGAPTRRLRGAPWLNNDGVNLLCTLTGALTAALMSSALP